MTSSLRVVFGLLAFSLAGIFLGDQEIYARLSYLWIFLISGNYILSKLALRGISLKRSARSLKGQVGEIFEETFEIINAGPIW